MRYLPLVSLALSLIGSVFLSASIARLYRAPGIRRAGDEWRAITFYTALLIALFNGRRFFMPADGQRVIALYASRSGLPGTSSSISGKREADAYSACFRRARGLDRRL